MNLRDLIADLASLNLVRLQHECLVAQSEQLAADLREALATPPGGPHDYPWRESGALQSSIATETDGLTSLVGSTDEVALHQEYGTATIPPRPFLAPLAEAHAEAAAQAVGLAVATALRSL